MMLPPCPATPKTQQSCYIFLAVRSTLLCKSPDLAVRQEVLVEVRLGEGQAVGGLRKADQVHRVFERRLQRKHTTNAQLRMGKIR